MAPRSGSPRRSRTRRGWRSLVHPTRCWRCCRGDRTTTPGPEIALQRPLLFDILAFRRISAAGPAMPRKSKSSLDEIRSFYATMMAVASGSTDPRFERAFELVRREAFVGPGPWHITIYQRAVETPSADPVFLYQNVVVNLDRARSEERRV